MKILFISGSNKQEGGLNDFMHDIVLLGLREIYGEAVVDYPGAWYLYSDEVRKRNYDIHNLWGKGFTLYDLLSNYQEIDRTDIENKIRTNYFDFIVFGSIQRSQIFLNEAINSKSKIIFVDGEDHAFINERIISKGIYFKRELISDSTKNVYPINFAVPKKKIIDTINTKPLNVLAPLIPDKKLTYIYQNEKDYYHQYQDSIFALTYKKVGWDSLRHYEILMNGCIPLFLNIEKCPKKILTNLPKKLFLDVFNQYSWILNQFFPTNIYKKKFLSIDKFFYYFFNLFKKKYTASSFITSYPEIFEIKNKMLEYTRNNLTTEKIAKDIISNTTKYYTK